MLHGDSSTWGKKSMTSDPVESLTRVPSGVTGLDTLLRGGFFRGGLYVIEGAPGTGKTILGNQICFNQARAGSKVLYVTLIAETVGRMLLNIGSMTFFDEAMIGSSIIYISGFTALKADGLQGLLHLLRREVTAHRARILVVDGFASAADCAKSGEELKIFVQELQTQADAAECTVFLLTNPTEQTASSEETMVEGIINLESLLDEARSAREMRVRKMRGTRIFEGVHSYRITGSGITVYPRLESLVEETSKDNGQTQKIASGIARLDEMLGGGLPERSMTMLVGPSGTGKTTIGLQFLAESTTNQPGLLFGFYEAPARIKSKARAICTSKAGVFESGEVEILWVPPNDQLLDDLGDRLLNAVRRRKVKRLVIDGLGGFNKAIRSRPIERFFSALAYILRTEGVTSICTAEVPEIIGPTITTPMHGLSDVTDNHVLLRFREVGAALYRLISILKVRDSGFDPALRTFSITTNGIEIAESSQSAESILASSFLRERKIEAISIGEEKTGDE